MENSLFVSDSELTDRINAAQRMVYRKIVKAYGDNYFGTSTNIATVSGTAAYALPTNFMKLGSYGVWWIPGTGQNVRLSRYTPNESLAQMPSQGWTWYPYGTQRSNVRYDLYGKQLRFMPTPLGAYTITVHYIPYPTPLAADGDTLDTLGGFEEAVIWDAVATCLQKQESDPSYANSMVQRELQDLAENIDPDQNEPPQVQWVNYPSYEDC
jgi:hypothetical protein